MLAASRYLVIEGVHRSGKTTACDFLSDLLRNYSTQSRVIEVPTKEEYLRYSREIPKGYPTTFADARLNEEWFLAQEMRRASMYTRLLDGGYFVVSSRDYLSTLCFSIAFSGYSGIDTSKIMENEIREAELSGKLAIPELTFWIDIRYKTMMERSANTGRRLDDIWSDERFFGLVREAYQDVLSRFDREYVKIDGDLPLAKIKSQLSGIMRDYYEKHRI